MALGNSATVRIEIEVDDNGTPVIRRFGRETEGAAGRAGRAMEGFNSSVGRVGKAIGGLGAIVIGGLAGVTAKVIEIGNDFDQQQRRLRAQTAKTAEETEKLGAMAQRIYGDTFAESVGTAMDTVRMSVQTMRGATEAQVEFAATAGQKINDAFEIDPEKSISAMKTLMDNYGVTVEQASDMITAGLQRGLNRSGDFLESIEEYSTQFRDAGFEAGEMFSAFETASHGGILGTDKIADAMKEFRLRIVDGSKKTGEALQSIGIDASNLEEQIDSGAISIADAFKTVMQKIGETESKATAFRAGADLMGVPFEDLGQEAAKNLDLTKTKIEDTAGATESLDVMFDGVGGAFKKLRATIESEAIAAFQKYEAELTAAIQSGTQWVQDHQAEIGQAFDQIKIYVEGLLGALGKMIEVGGKAVGFVKDLSGMAGALSSGSVGLSDFNRQGMTVSETLDAMADGSLEVRQRVADLKKEYQDYQGQLSTMTYIGDEEKINAAKESLRGIQSEIAALQAANPNINIEFTGEGSSVKPLGDKAKEMTAAVQGVAEAAGEGATMEVAFSGPGGREGLSDLAKKEASILADTFTEAQKKITAEEKRALSERQRLAEQFADDHMRATLSWEEYEIAKLDEQTKKYEAAEFDRLEVNEWYWAERRKITEQAHAEEIRAEQRAAEEKARVVAEFNREYDQVFKTRFEREQERIDDLKKRAEANNVDRLKIEKWYQAESTRIAQEAQEERFGKLNGAFDKIAKGNLQGWREMLSLMGNDWNSSAASWAQSGQTIFGQLFGWIGQAAGSLLGKLGAGVGGLWESLKGAGGGIMKAIGGLFGGGGGGGGGILGAVGGLFKGDGLLGGVGDMFRDGGMLSGVGDMFGTVKDVAGDALVWVKDTAGSAWNGIKNIAGDAWDVITNTTGGAVNFVKDQIGGLVSSGGLGNLAAGSGIPGLSTGGIGGGGMNNTALSGLMALPDMVSGIKDLFSGDGFDPIAIAGTGKATYDAYEGAKAAYDAATTASDASSLLSGGGGANIVGGAASIAGGVMSGDMFGNEYGNYALGAIETFGAFTEYGAILSGIGEELGELLGGDTGAQIGAGAGAGAGIGAMAAAGSSIGPWGTVAGAVMGAAMALMGSNSNSGIPGYRIGEHDSGFFDRSDSAARGNIGVGGSLLSSGTMVDEGERWMGDIKAAAVDQFGALLAELPEDIASGIRTRLEDKTVTLGAGRSTGEMTTTKWVGGNRSEGAGHEEIVKLAPAVMDGSSDWRVKFDTLTEDMGRIMRLTNTKMVETAAPAIEEVARSVIAEFDAGKIQKFGFGEIADLLKGGIDMEYNDSGTELTSSNVAGYMQAIGKFREGMEQAQKAVDEAGRKIIESLTLDPEEAAQNAEAAIKSGPTKYEQALGDLDGALKQRARQLDEMGVSESVLADLEAKRPELVEQLNNQWAQARQAIMADADAIIAGITGTQEAQNEMAAAISETDKQFEALAEAIRQSGGSAAEVEAVHAKRAEAEAVIREEYEKTRQGIMETAREMAGVSELTELDKAIRDVNKQFEGMRRELMAAGASADELKGLDALQAQSVAYQREHQQINEISAAKERAHQAEMAAVNAVAEAAAGIEANLASARATMDQANWMASTGGSANDYQLDQIRQMQSGPVTMGGLEQMSGMLSQWYQTAASQAAQQSSGGSSGSDGALGGLTAAGTAVSRSASAQEDAADAMDKQTDAMNQLVRSLDATIESITYSDLNLALGEDRQAQAEQDYTKLKARAYSDDATQEDLQAFFQFSQRYLQESQKLYKSSEQYQDIYSGVMGDLEGLRGTAQTLGAQQSGGAPAGASGGYGGGGSSSGGFGPGGSGPSLDEINSTFEELSGWIQQQMDAMSDTAWILEIDWKGLEGDSAAAIQMLAGIVEQNGWSSEMSLTFLSEMGANFIGDINNYKEIIEYIGSEAGWDSEALLTFTSSLDFSQFQGDMDDARDLVSWTAGQSGWDGEATLNMVSALAKSQFVKDMDDAKDLITWTAGQTGWDGDATLTVLSSLSRDFVKSFDDAKDLISWTADQAGWDGKATLTVLGDVDTSYIDSLEDAQEMVTWAMDQSGQGWDGKATLTLIGNIAASYPETITQARELITWAAAETGWDGQATLTVLSNLDTEQYVSSFNEAKDLIEWQMNESGEGWDGKATLTLLSNLAGDKWMGDVGQAKEMLGWIGDEAGWNGEAMLTMVSQLNTEKLTADVGQAKEMIDWMGTEAGWDGQATLDLVSRLADSDLVWTDIQQILNDHGVTDRTVIKTIKAAYDAGASPYSEWPDLETAMHDSGVTVDVVKAIKGQYSGNMTWPDLEYMLKDSGVPENVVADIRANISGEVEAKLGAQFSTFNSNLGMMDATLGDLSAVFREAMLGQYAQDEAISLADGFIMLHNDIVALQDSGGGGGDNAIVTELQTANDWLSSIDTWAYNAQDHAYSAASYLGSISAGFAYGGVASGPETGYLARLHGTELVVSRKASVPARVAGDAPRVDTARMEALLVELVQVLRQKDTAPKVNVSIDSAGIEKRTEDRIIRRQQRGVI